MCAGFSHLCLIHTKQVFYTNHKPEEEKRIYAPRPVLTKKKREKEKKK